MITVMVTIMILSTVIYEVKCKNFNIYTTTADKGHVYVHDVHMMIIDGPIRGNGHTLLY